MVGMRRGEVRRCVVASLLTAEPQWAVEIGRCLPERVAVSVATLRRDLAVLVELGRAEWTPAGWVAAERQLLEV